jgi:hypothetical protein
VQCSAYDGKGAALTLELLSNLELLSSLLGDLRVTVKARVGQQLCVSSGAAADKRDQDSNDKTAFFFLQSRRSKGVVAAHVCVLVKQCDGQQRDRDEQGCAGPPLPSLSSCC